MSQRSDNIRFKILPDGNIRAYQVHKGKCGASEWYLTTFMGGVSPTLTTAQPRKLLIIKPL